MKKITLVIALLYATSFSAQEVAVAPLTKQEKASKIAKAFLASEKIPGMALSVSKNNEIIWSKGFGYADIDAKTTVNPAVTQFRLASISKPITAAGLAILADRGKMNYDASLYTYLPNYPKKKYDFTIRQIGGHIAGIRHYKGQEFIINKKMSITEGLNIFKDDPLLHEPGSKYQYSTYGWNLLSVVIQAAAGREFNQFMIENLFNPLKMNSTRLDLFEDPMPNRCKFYVKNYQGKIYPAPKVSNEHKVAGGGFVATAEDLIKFGNEVLTPKIISPKNFAELVKAQTTNDGKSTGYGIGFGVGESENKTVKYSHSGGGAGATTLLLMYPKEKVVIAMLTNLSQVKIRELGKQLEAVFLD